MILHLLNSFSWWDLIAFCPVGLLLDTLANIGLGLAGAYGSKPQVAQYKPIPTGPGAAVSSDISAFPQISQLGNLYQSYLTDQMNQQLPGFSNVLAQGEGTTQQMLSDASPLLKGQIPQDVIDQIQRSDAYTSLSGGYAGSQMGKNLTARDLGLTSLDLMNQGANLAGQGGNAAQRWQQIAQGQTFNPASMFVNPQQMFQEQQSNELYQLGTQQAKYNVSAAPDPTMVGISGALGSMFGQLTSLGGIMGSSGGGASPSGGYNLGSMFGSYNSDPYASPNANDIGMGTQSSGGGGGLLGGSGGGILSGLLGLL